MWRSCPTKIHELSVSSVQGWTPSLQLSNAVQAELYNLGKVEINIVYWVRFRPKSTVVAVFSNSRWRGVTTLLRGRVKHEPRFHKIVPKAHFSRGYVKHNPSTEVTFTSLTNLKLKKNRSGAAYIGLSHLWKILCLELSFLWKVQAGQSTGVLCHCAIRSGDSPVTPGSTRDISLQ